MLHYVVAVVLLVLAVAGPVWAEPAVGGASASTSANFDWHGRTYRADRRFLLRIDGPRIAERWTFPGPILTVVAAGDSLKVTWSQGPQATDQAIWRPGRPTPAGLLDTLDDVTVAPQEAPGSETDPIPAYRRAIALDPTNPWYHLHLAEAALARRLGPITEVALDAIFASPHLTFADWTNLMVAFERLGLPARADLAYERAVRDFQARDYRPELIGARAYGDQLFHGGGPVLAALRRAHSPREFVLIERIAHFLPNAMHVDRMWAAMAVRQADRAQVWQMRADAAHVTDVVEAAILQQSLAFMLAAAVYGTCWLFTLRWACRRVFRWRTLVVLVLLLSGQQGLCRWLDRGFAPVTQATAPLLSGYLGSAAVRHDLASAPPGPDRDRMLTFAEAQAAGTKPVAPSLPAILPAYRGPLLWSDFRPWPDSASFRQSEAGDSHEIVGGPEAILTGPTWLGLAVVAWGIAWLVWRRRTLPTWARLLIPGLADPDALLAPVATTAWLLGIGGLLHLGMMTLLDVSGYYDWTLLGLHSVGIIPEMPSVLPQALALVALGWVLNGALQWRRRVMTRAHAVTA